MFHFDPAPTKSLGRRQLAYNCYRTFVDGLLCKLAAIGARSWKGEKQESRLHAARVILQSRYRRLAQIDRQLLPEPHALEDQLNCH